MRFLLDPDPDSPYEPRIRLVNGLSLATGDSPTSTRGRTSKSSMPRWNRPGAAFCLTRRSIGDLVDVLSGTDQPDLLAVLERGFARGLKLHRVPQNPYGEPLWGEDGECRPDC